MMRRPLWLVLALISLLAFACSDDHADSTDTSAGDTAGLGDTTEADGVGDVLDDTTLADTTGTDVSADTGVDTGPSIEQIEIPPGPWTSLARGPYNVGYRQTNIEYTPPGGNGSRSLRVAIWYPTRDSKGFVATYLNIVRREQTFKNAAVSDGGPFPLLVFSHGYSGYAEQSYFFTEFFASHGWVVVAPDHTLNTIANAADPVPVEILYWRPNDITQSLDLIDTLNADPEDPLYQKVTGDVLMAGHSFGGYTSLAVAGASFAVDKFLAGCAQNLYEPWICQTLTQDEEIYRAGFLDPRVQAIVPMAPGGTISFGPEGVADIDVPVLLMTGSLDNSTTNAADGDPTWAELDGDDDMRLNFATAGHLTFSDACELLGPDPRGCGPDFVDVEEAHHAITAYALAFARWHLFADSHDLGLLTGVTTVSEDVTLSFK